MSDLERIERHELQTIITEAETRMLEAKYGKAMPSQRWRQIYDFIEQFERDHGFCPSFEQIGAGVGLSSLATVSKHIAGMSEKGIIVKKYNEPRSIKLNPEYARGMYVKVSAQ